MIKIDTWVRDNATIGFLQYKDFKCCTLELPWEDNNKDVSCIPAGIYDAVKYDSPKHGEVLLLLDVHGRDMIEIHSGNYTRQILGCILVGDGIKFLDSDDIPDVTNSRNTLAKLLDVITESVPVHIERHW